MRQGAVAPVLLLAAVVASCSSVEQVFVPPEPLPMTVTFDGARHFSTSTLEEFVRPDIERYAKRARPTVLDDAAFRLATEYRTAGYWYVKVEPGVEGPELSFVIEEGPRVFPGRVHFLENVEVSDEEIKEALPETLLASKVPFSPRLLSAQVDAILALYARKGFIDASVAEPTLRYDEPKGRMNVSFVIREGRRHRLVDVTGRPAGIDRVEKQVLEMIGRVYTPSTRETLEAIYTDWYRDHDHPFARVLAETSIDREKGEVVVDLKVEPGPAANYGPLRIKGLEGVRPGFVASRAKLQEGRPYDAREVRGAEERLRKTGLFRSVRIGPGDFSDVTGLVDLDVFLEEREPGEASLRFGYGTLDGPRVGADIAYLNLFGGGEFARLGGTVSRFGGNVTLDTGIPYVFGTEFRPGLTLTYEQVELPSYDASSFGAVPSLTYPLTDSWIVTGGVRFADVRTTDVDAGVPPGDLLDFRYHAFFLSTTVDRRDSALLTSRGWYLHLTAERTGRSAISDIDFSKFSGRLSTFLPVRWGLTLAASFQGGVIHPLAETDEIPISLRYFAGGTNTVRGFEYATLGPLAGGDPTGGELYAAAQIEVRFPVWRDLYGAVFHDRGNVWFESRDLDWDETRWSVGAGLRYHTPAGAIVLDVAWNPSREDDEDAVEAHLSIGFPF